MKIPIEAKIMMMDDDTVKDFVGTYKPEHNLIIKIILIKVQKKIYS